MKTFDSKKVYEKYQKIMSENKAYSGVTVSLKLNFRCSNF